MGDFNINILNLNIHNPTSEFVDTLYEYNFFPLINKPTRAIKLSATLIDNIFTNNIKHKGILSSIVVGGPRVVVSTAAFHARVRGSVPGLGGLKETKNVSSPSTCESQYCGEPP